MIDTSFLPQTGEPVTLPDGSPATVAWCSGWTWPIGLDRPTRYFAQALTPAGKLTDPLPVYPTDLGGGRRWMAERRDGA